MSDSAVTKTPEQQLFEVLGGNLLPPAPAVAVGEKVAAEPPEPANRPITPKNIFWNSEAHPYVLDLVMLKFFGVEWFSWLPDTVFAEIEQTFSKSVGDTTKMKIMAVQTLHVVDSFWERWEVFEKTLLALNGIWPKLDVMQVPELAHLFAGVAVANDIRKEEFSEEVSRYIAGCFLHANVTAAPPPFEFVQPYISQPSYRCRDCGRTGSALPPFDGYCDTCAGKFDKAHPFSFTPDPERVARGLGRNIEMYLEHDPLPALKKYREYLDAKPETIHIEDKPEDVEASRLVVAHDFTLFRENQKQEQLAALKDWLGPST